MSNKRTTVREVEIATCQRISCGRKCGYQGFAIYKDRVQCSACGGVTFIRTGIVKKVNGNRRCVIGEPR